MAQKIVFLPNKNLNLCMFDLTLVFVVYTDNLNFNLMINLLIRYISWMAERQVLKVFCRQYTGSPNPEFCGQT